MSPGPLTGLRVLDLAAHGTRTPCGTLLAGLGAEVVRVGSGADADAVLALVAGADVLVDGRRPEVAGGLGIGPERCLARNPRLVYGRDPLHVYFGSGEVTAALYLTVGVLAGLARVASTGRGQVVDGTLVGCPYYSVYRTADGQQMAVGAVEPDCYLEFVRLLGVWDMVPEHREPPVWSELRRVFAGTFRTRTQREWCAVFDGAHAGVTPMRPHA